MSVTFLKTIRVLESMRLQSFGNSTRLDARGHAGGVLKIIRL
jgi:hypothetical protein